LNAGVNRFTYTYDFGDDWEHNILIEKAVPKTALSARPCCSAGAGACPPEDCGGASGYYMLLEAVSDPDHPNHAEMSDWLGGDIDPQDFSIEEANRRLDHVFGRSR
jgi:hypothetical protein